MKKLITLASLAFLLNLGAADAFAWELTLKGATEYRYRYLTRFGQNDLFGNVNIVPLGINHIKQWTSEDTWQNG